MGRLSPTATIRKRKHTWLVRRQTAPPRAERAQSRVIRRRATAWREQQHASTQSNRQHTQDTTNRQQQQHSTRIAAKARLETGGDRAKHDDGGWSALACACAGDPELLARSVDKSVRTIRAVTGFHARERPGSRRRHLTGRAVMHAQRLAWVTSTWCAPAQKPGG